MSNFNFIICASGTLGDMYPLIALAKKIQAGGNSVTFLSNETFSRLVKSEGIEFKSVSGAKAYKDFHSKNEVWNPNINPFDIGYETYFRPSMINSYRFILDNKSPLEKTILIVISKIYNGAAIAAEQLGVPVIVISLNTSHLMANAVLPSKARIFKYFSGFKEIEIISGYRKIKNKQYFLDMMNLRQLTGFRGFRKLMLNENKNYILHLAFFPAWYGSDFAITYPKIKFLGFPIYDVAAAHKSTVVDGFLELHKNKSLLFTTGTGVHDATEFFTEGRAVCEMLRLPGVFVGGTLGEMAVKNSEYCLHVPNINFCDFFQKCSVIIHHGGIGTVAQAIRSGVPQIIRPLAYDQPTNARIIENLRLGIVINKNDFKADYIIKKIGLLKSDETSKRIEAYSARLNREDVISDAYQLITSKILEL